MPIDAAKPFDSSAKADAVLRSSDSVDFYVIGPLLSTVSPIFDDMFSLTRPGVQQEITNNGLPVVPLSESSKILQFLLCLIYPYIDKPELIDGELFAAVCLAARKYGMDLVEGKLKKMVLASSLIKEEAFRIYSIAVRMGAEWNSVAVTAAQNTLTIPLKSLPLLPELHWITGGDLYHYVQWRIDRENATNWQSNNVVSSIGRPPPSMNNWQSTMQAATESEDTANPFDISARADMILRSSDMVDFFVLEGLLRFASPIFESMISSGTVNSNGMKVVSVTENSQTLRRLLLLLYHRIDTPSVDAGTLYLEMGEVAKKYGLQFVESRLRLSLRSSLLMTSHPLRAYAIAMKFGWAKEATSAAVNTLGTSFRYLGYCSELERITGTDFFRLLEHRFKCVDTVSELVTNMETSLPGDFISSGSSQRSYPLPSSVKARIQEVLKQCPRGSAISKSHELNIRAHNATNVRQRGSTWTTPSIPGVLTAVIDEAVLKVALNMGASADVVLPN